MKRSLLKTIVLFLTIAFTVAAFAGCTGTSGQKPDQTTAATQAPATNAPGTAETVAPVADPYAEHLDLMMCVYWDSLLYPLDDTEIMSLVEEKFNVSIEIMPVNVNDAEAWPVFWAGGGSADSIQSNVMAKYRIDFADQQVIRSIPEEWLYEYAPDWMEDVQSLVSDEYIRAFGKYQGKTWFLPYCNYSSVQTLIQVVRRSWMDAVGVGVPTTLEEYHDMLVKFVTDDPDGNGVADTYGYPMYWGGGLYPTNYIRGALGGTQVHAYRVDDSGNVTYSDMSEDYKEFLQLLSDWYAEGLIDPEFVTDGRNECRAKWAGGIYGLQEDHPWWCAASTSGNVPSLVTANYPDEEFVYLQAFAGPDGSSGVGMGLVELSNVAVYFGYDATDEKVIRVLRMYNELCADFDWLIRMQMGVYGETYTVTDGIYMKNTALSTDVFYLAGIGNAFGLAPFTEDYLYTTSKPMDKPPYECCYANPTFADGRNFLPTGENEAYNLKGADVSTLSNQYAINVVTGQANLEGDYDQFIQNLINAGVNDIIAAYKTLLP